MTKKKQRGRRPEIGRSLSLKELDHLDEWLASRPTGCQGIERLDGFLAAILAGPGLIPPSQAMGYILGEVEDPDRPTFATMAESERLINLILRHWNAVAAGLLRGDYPPSLTAVDGHTFGIDWAGGFLDGTDFWRAAWRGLLADPTWRADLEPILALAHRPAEIDDATRERYLDSLGPIAVDIRHHFVAEPAPPQQAAMDLGSDNRWPIPDDVPPHWEAGWIPVPARIKNEPDAGVVAALIVSEAGRIVGLSPRLRPPVEALAMAKLLAREVGAAIAAEGAPPEIWVTDQDTATALRRLPVLRNTILDIREALPVFEAVRADFAREFGAGVTAFAVTWTGWGLTPGLVARLFQASAALFRGAPWRLYADADLLLVRWPSGAEWVISVMGAGGIERGLMCFTDPEDPIQILLGRSGEAPQVKGLAVGLGFVPPDDLSPEVRRDIMAHDWQVAAPEAYPSVALISAPAGLPEQIAIQLCEAIEAVTRFGSTKARRRSPVWLDKASGIAIEPAKPDRS